MAIKGLTDRGLSFPQIGNIRKGDKSGRNGAPKDLNYFKVDFDEKETLRAEKFQKVYGDKPDEINILFPFNEIERVWDAWCEGYTAGRMVARSDGEYFSYLVDIKTGEVLVKDGQDKDGQRVPHKEIIGRTGENGKTVIKCRPVGRLKVIIPELQSLAYLVVHTTSVIDIRNISEQLEAIRTFNGGRIAGIPLVLRRRPKKISVPRDDGTKARLVKYMLSIEADPQWVEAKLAEVNRLALPGERPALPAPKPEEPEYIDVQASEVDENDNYDQSTEEPWTNEIAEEQAEPEDELIPDLAPEVAPQQTAEELLGEVTTPKGTRLGDLTTDALNQFVAAIDVGLSKGKVCDDDLAAAYRAAKELIALRNHQPA